MISIPSPIENIRKNKALLKLSGTAIIECLFQNKNTMKITINNLQNANNILLLSQVPNILTLEDVQENNYAQLELTTYDVITTKKASITINGITITSTNILENAVNNVFYINYNVNTSFLMSDIARALNSTSLSANYKIWSNKNVLYVKAKQASASYNIIYSIDGINLYQSNTTVSNNSVLTDSNITLQLLTSDGEYITSLSKKYLNDKLSFNLSPLFVSLLQFDELREYDIKLVATQGTKLTELYEMDNVKVLNGYKLDNDSLNYITHNNSNKLLQDFDGDLYYNSNDREFQLTIYNHSKKPFSYTVQEYNGNTRLSSMQYDDETMSNYCILTIPVYRTDATHVTITLPEIGEVKYINTAKNNYTNPEEHQTVYWNNSFGGISFFPFTFSKTEEYSTEKEIITTNVFEYYNNQNTKKVYSNTTQTTVTLTSQYLPKNTEKLFKDLNKSMNAYIIDNKGNKKTIIINSVAFNKVNNNTYQAEIQYVK